MLDIKLIREKPDLVRQGLQNRGGRYLPDLEKAIQKDLEWRAVLTDLENLRGQRNKISEEVGKLKKEKKDASDLLKSMETLKADLKEKEEKERTLNQETELLLLGLPNLPDASVHVGRTPEENKVVREHGTKPAFGFKPKDHHELGVSLGILDFDTATKLSGGRFSLYLGAGARCHRNITGLP